MMLLANLDTFHKSVLLKLRIILINKRKIYFNNIRNSEYLYMGTQFKKKIRKIILKRNCLILAYAYDIYMIGRTITNVKKVLKTEAKII